MAARNLPVPAFTHTINIDPTLTPSYQGLIVAGGDTVNFTNNSGQDVTIIFAHNPPGADIYPNMSLPVPNGTTAGFTAPTSNCAGNYSILGANGAETGPWVIQVGAGPMFVMLSKSANVVIYTPPTVAVPLGSTITGMGMLQINSHLPNLPFNINWDTTDPFNPPLTATGQNRPVSASTPPDSYDYGGTPNMMHKGVAASHAIARVGTGGGGTVIIRGA
jgi:hypothetical protein